MTRLLVNGPNVSNDLRAWEALLIKGAVVAPPISTFIACLPVQEVIPLPTLINQ